MLITLLILSFERLEKNLCQTTYLASESAKKRFEMNFTLKKLLLSKKSEVTNEQILQIHQSFVAKLK